MKFIEDAIFTEFPFHSSKGNGEMDRGSKSVFSMTFSAIVFLIGLIFLGRLIEIQLLKTDYYSEIANNNRLREFTEFAERGVVFDRNGELLVQNIPAFSVQLNTKICDTSCDIELDELAKYVDFDKSKIDISKNSVLVKGNLTQEDILPLEANLDLFKSVSISITPVRYYPYNEAMAHLLGYVGLDEQSLEPNIVGKTGLEAFYNRELSGINGAQVVEIDSSGKSYVEVYTKESYSGRDLHTYIDADLQKEAYYLLKEKVDNSDATGGVVVAQDPSNGGVIVLVSYPSYDPNKLVVGVSSKEFEEINKVGAFPFFNRAIGAVYPPGSVFKMVTASAVLMENIVTKDVTIFDPGFIEVSGFIFRNWKLDGHGIVGLITALQKSNDTYFYTVSGGYGGIKGLGMDKLYSWATKFGFGLPTGIDLFGEVAGHFPNGKGRDWYLGDTYITSIGQGDILATPIQVNNMVTYFANGGSLFKPRIIRNLESESPIVPAPIIENIVSADHYNSVREGMKAAVTNGGTAYPFFDFEKAHGIDVGGKTGTSEFFTPEGVYSTHAWFSVFAPFTDDSIKPITLTVFLEGGGSGSDDAAPIARKLMDLWVSMRS